MSPIRSITVSQGTVGGSSAVQPVMVGVGPKGDPGPTGITATVRGAYNAGTTYTAGPPPDVVLGSDGRWYVSLTNANVGHDPTTDGAVHWAPQVTVAGVTTFNTRSGPVTLLKADVTGTGLAPADISAEATANKGAANGYASLDGSGLLPTSQLPVDVLEYKGTYNAATNTPSLSNGTGGQGDFYKVSVAGSRDFGAGAISLGVNDSVLYDGSVWQKIEATHPIASATTILATNAAWPIPTGASVLEIIAVGGGAGGGGGGSEVGTTQNSGGGGGGAGSFTQAVVNVGANTTLAVTIGAGGAGGSLSAAGGNPGGTGSVGGNTTVVGTGISVTAMGGSGGAGALASSTSAVNGGIMGQLGSGVAGLASATNPTAGSGGGSTGGAGPVIRAGGAGFGPSAGGGGGGGTATTTLGGTGGGAGTPSAGGAAGAAGGSGTSAGTAGGTAAANSGGGGGGGGSGAAGTGAGAVGGTGGSGFVIIKVVG